MIRRFLNRLMRTEKDANPVLEYSESDFFPLAVGLHEDGTFSIEWDEHDPVTSVFNDWTEEDFAEALRNWCEDALAATVAESWENASKEEVSQ